MMGAFLVTRRDDDWMQAEDFFHRVASWLVATSLDRPLGE